MSHGLGVPGTMGGLSLSQPSSQPDGIYSVPVDSLPQNMIQKISKQMPVNRVIGQKSFKSSNNKLNGMMS